MLYPTELRAHILILNDFRLQLTILMYCFTALFADIGSKMCRNCAQTPGFLHSGCDFRVHFICLAIHFFECLPLHSQLHQRILFEDLRVALTKQLRDPLY